MAKFVFLYAGGKMADTPAGQQEAMEAWGAWFGTLGGAVVDHGNPFGASSTVLSNGSSKSGGASGVGGYSIIDADSLAGAADLAKGCPVLTSGGTVEVYEAMPM
jgi:hypothetical protein